MRPGQEEIWEGGTDDQFVQRVTDRGYCEMGRLRGLRIDVEPGCAIVQQGTPVYKMMRDDRERQMRIDLYTAKAGREMPLFGD
jgi:hypothetical protein